jgi:hypothetical protein
MKPIQSAIRSIVGGVSLIAGLECKLYSGVHETFINGYGWDIMIPVIAYNLYKFPKNDYLRAGFAFACCSALEIAQKFGWYSGTFDTRDFIAYGTGTALALGIDKLTSRILDKH